MRGLRWRIVSWRTLGLMGFSRSALSHLRPVFLKSWTVCCPRCRLRTRIASFNARCRTVAGACWSVILTAAPTAAATTPTAIATRALAPVRIGGYALWLICIPGLFGPRLLLCSRLRLSWPLLIRSFALCTRFAADFALRLAILTMLAITSSVLMSTILVVCTIRPLLAT